MTKASMLCVATMIFALLAEAPPTYAHQDAEDTLTMSDFAQAIDDYMALHRRMEADLPPLEISRDWGKIRLAVEAMGSAVREARASARLGDIFGPHASLLLRRRIGEAIDRCDYDLVDLLDEFTEDMPEDAELPVLNEPFSWNLGSGTPPGLLAALPPLPDELQYRFVGRDLVLVDIHASLVVDILFDALP
jgi:hypothetical protein